MLLRGKLTGFLYIITDVQTEHLADKRNIDYARVKAYCFNTKLTSEMLYTSAMLMENVSCGSKDDKNI